MARGKGRGGVSRQTVRKYPSSKVQGSGAHISFYKPSWKEVREATSDLREMTREMLVTVRGRAAPKEGVSIQEIEDKIAEYVWTLAVAKFDEWNWVDDDDEPLKPLPDLAQEDLLAEEVDFIIDCVKSLYLIEEQEGN